MEEVWDPNKHDPSKPPKTVIIPYRFVFDFQGFQKVDMYTVYKYKDRLSRRVLEFAMVDREIARSRNTVEELIIEQVKSSVAPTVEPIFEEEFEEIEEEIEEEVVDEQNPSSVPGTE